MCPNMITVFKVIGLNAPYPFVFRTCTLLNREINASMKNVAKRKREEFRIHVNEYCVWDNYKRLREYLMIDDYYVLPNGKRDGLFTRTYDNEVINIECNYNSGKIEGTYLTYYKSGKLWIIAEYKNGKLNGCYRNYHENGNMREECTYIDDKGQGESTRWHADGRIAMTFVYKDDHLISEHQHSYDMFNRETMWGDKIWHR